MYLKLEVSVEIVLPKIERSGLLQIFLIEYRVSSDSLLPVCDYFTLTETLEREGKGIVHREFQKRNYLFLQQLPTFRCSYWD